MRSETGNDSRSPAAIITAAHAWIGTPYHHQASCRGVGADCLGLVRGIYRDVMGCDAELPPAYSRDWGDANGQETLIAAARRHLIEIAVGDAAPGDVLVFRLRAGLVAKHTGLKVSPTSMIHAVEGSDAAEVTLTPWWQRRIAAAFTFPGPTHLPGDLR